MSWKNDQVTKEETKKILTLAESALLVEGDFVELGCYKGDTSLLLAEILKNYNDRNSKGGFAHRLDETKENESIEDRLVLKRLWIYDSFEGLPIKTVADQSPLGVNFKTGELAVTKRMVKERFLRSGLPLPIIKKGWFSELTIEDLPSQIAFAFLDGDFYESIRDSLRLIAPKVKAESIIVVHDYTNPALPGVRQAVDEWVKTLTTLRPHLYLL